MLPGLEHVPWMEYAPGLENVPGLERSSGAGATTGAGAMGQAQKSVIFFNCPGTYSHLKQGQETQFLVCVS